MFEDLHATTCFGVVGVAAYMGPAERQGVRHDGGVVVGGAQELEGDGEAIGVFGGIDELARPLPDRLCSLQGLPGVRRPRCRLTAHRLGCGRHVSAQAGYRRWLRRLRRAGPPRPRRGWLGTARTATIPA